VKVAIARYRVSGKFCSGRPWVFLTSKIEETRVTSRNCNPYNHIREVSLLVYNVFKHIDGYPLTSDSFNCNAV